MKLTNEEQMKRSLIRTQKRLLDLEERVERLEAAIRLYVGDRFMEKLDAERNGDEA